MLSIMKCRAGENINYPAPVRTDRFFSAQGAWYFSTREGNPIGPFEGKEDARKGLDDFIEFIQLAKPQTLSRLHAVLAN